MFYLYKMATYELTIYKIMSEYINLDSDDRKHYKDVWAPTMTVAVGLKPCVVLHPMADSAIITSNVAALKLAIFLPYFL